MKRLNKTVPKNLTEVRAMSIKMTVGQHLFLSKEAKKRGLRARDLIIKAVKQYIQQEKIAE